MARPPLLPRQPTTTGPVPGCAEPGCATCAGAAVAVVGLGYVGLPTALALLSAGHRVIGVDVRAARVEAIRALEVDLPPDLRKRLAGRVNDPHLRLVTDPAALAEAAAVVICVPTPIDRHQAPDLRALTTACGTAVERAVPGQLLVLTSTTYVGTTRDLLVAPLAARGLRVGTDVFVAFSPERIDPGGARHAPESVPRVVGGADPESTERAAALLARTAPAVHRLDSPEQAEMTKLWENTFRAVNIALANELADHCREFGFEPLPVVEAAATKPYGFMPFYPGPGVGGHCVPCDPHYLLWQLRARRVASPVVKEAMSAIASRPRRVVARARELLAERGRPVRGARILLVGLAYKPAVADLRESPALEILAELAAGGAVVEYTDALIPTATVAGRTLRSRQPSPDARWDLVLVHTRHPGDDLAWLADQPTVLDVSQRAPRPEEPRAVV